MIHLPGGIMSDPQSHVMTRCEKELIRYFRELSPENQLDLLGAAEASYNAVARMKELGDREVERRPLEGEWH
jgi:hypothetical protein